MGKELILKNIHLLFVLTDKKLSDKIRRAIYNDPLKSKEVIDALREVSVTHTTLPACDD
jgi:hypothetical protein